MDSQLLLCLVAIHQLGGGQPVPAKQDLFTKGLKKPLQAALENGWVRADKADVATVGKTGKTKIAKQDVLLLTAEGSQVLRQAASPEALAAGAAAQVQAFRAQLEGDRQALQQEVRSAFAGKSKAKGGDPVAKEMSALSKVVADLARRLEKIESLAPTGPDPILQHLDQAFARLEAKLGNTSATPASATPPKPAPTLRDVLKSAYDDLCLLMEFEERLVPLPRLYHQAKSAFPGLTVANFHREIETLSQERHLELHVLNEVRTASEPDKAIRRGDDFFYYVLWKKS